MADKKLLKKFFDLNCDLANVTCAIELLEHATADLSGDGISKNLSGAIGTINAHLDNLYAGYEDLYDLMEKEGGNK